MVDDDVDFVSELGEGLELAGIPAVTATDAVAALDIADRHHELRVIVTDINIPRINGIELLNKLHMRRGLRPVQAIVITGHASLDRAVDALRAGAVDFLQKPLSVQEVAHAIRRVSGLTGEEEGHVALPLAEAYLRTLVAARHDKNALFSPNLFSDPAWEMMLDLTVVDMPKHPVSVTSLCLASGVPTSTALRRISDLQDAGLIERIPDRNDRRRVMVRLTEEGRARMSMFIERQLKFFRERT